jgi:protein O-mannosyl-transferase
MAKIKTALRNAEQLRKSEQPTAKEALQAEKTNRLLTWLISLNSTRVLLLIVLASCFAYANSLGGDFVFDDIEQIIENKDIGSWSNLERAFTTPVGAFRKKPEALRVPIPPPYYRPLFTVLFTIEYQLFGLKPQGWHLISLFLHILCAIGVYYVVHELSRKSGVAVVAAILFAVHSIHVESVSWISGVTDPLFAVFFLASYYFYLRHRTEKKRLLFIYSLVLFALAIYSKETALSLVPLVFISEWIASNRPASPNRPGSQRFGERVKAASLTTLPYVGVTALYLIPRVLVLGGLTSYNPNTYKGPLLHTLLTLPSVVCSYLLHLLFPFHLRIASHTSFETSGASVRFLVPALVLATLCGAVIAYRKKFTRDIWYALALFVMPLLPVLDLRQLSVEYLIFDRYLYLSVAGWVYLLALGIVRFAEREEQQMKRSTEVSSFQRIGFASIVTAALVIVLTATTARENLNWSSQYALWTNAARVRPEFWAGQYNAGLALLDAKQYGEALDALNKAALVAPYEPNVFDGLGRTYTALGETTKAIENFKRAIELDPQMFESLNNLGNVYSELGDIKAAEEYYKTSLAVKPQAVASRFNLALCYKRRERFAEAATELERALVYAPDDIGVYYELGLAYEKLGRKDDARKALQRALALSKTRELADKISEDLRRLQ